MPAHLGNAVCRAETRLAIQVDIGKETYWIPKSVVDPESEVHEKNDIGELIVRTWFADREGIPYSDW